MAAARSAGAALFLAPTANCAEIRGAIPDGLTVAAVETLEQAVDVLEGDLAPPQCPAG
jgi:PDZ domain-containing protein